MRTPFYVLTLTAIVGCAGIDYVYTPQTANTTLTGGLPGSRTEIPPERPQGSVEVASIGVATLRMQDARVPTLHVRMIVSNDGDQTPWTVDSRNQLVDIPGSGSSAPLYVNTDVRTSGPIQIGLRQRRVIDLYYPLPATMNEEDELPRFDMLWQVETATRSVASRTSFDRVDPVYYDYWAYPYMTWPLYGGYGPYWWGYGGYAHAYPIDRAPTVHVGQFHRGYQARR